MSIKKTWLNLHISLLITGPKLALQSNIEKSRLQEEVNGGATTDKWDRMKVAAQSKEIEDTRDSEKVLPEVNWLAQGLLNG